MVPIETQYPSIEKLAFAILVASQKVKPYFQTYMIAIHTSHSLRQVLHHPETLDKLMKWSIELS